MSLIGLSPAQFAGPPEQLPAPQPAAGPQQLVVDVKIEGNRTVPTAKVLSEVRTRVGRPYRQDVVQSDVSRLATRGWFIDVKPFSQQVAGGQIVTFRVVERPTLRYVQYLGNDEIDDKTLAEETGLKVGDPLDPYAVEEASRKLQTFYHEKGFNRARVSILEGDQPRDQGAVFVLHEGVQQRYSSVRFEGNTIASDSRLKTQIQSKPGILYYFKGFVDRKKIDQDVTKLTAYYRSLGFFRARIGREIEMSDNGKWATLTFVINEGPRYRIRSASFLGNKVFASAQLDEAMELKSGETFDQVKMNRDLARLRDIYGSRGYVFADIQADPRFLEQPGWLDLVYDIEEGKPYSVGKITVHIRGENPHTRRQVVLNRLSLATGDLIDIRKIRASERRLQASQVFESSPQTGKQPRIVIRPPGSDEPQIAGKPRRTNFRGQSPDGLSQFPALAQRARRVPPLDINIYLDRSHPLAQQVLRQGRDTPVVRFQSPTQPASYGSQPLGQIAPGGQARTVYPYPTSGGPTSLAPTTAGQFQTARPVTNAAGNQVFAAPGTLPSVVGQPLITNPGLYEPLPPGAEPVPLGVSPLPLNIDVITDETQTGRFMLGLGVNSDAGLLGQITIHEQNFDWRRFPTSWQDVVNGTAWRGGGQTLRLEAQPGDQVQRYLASWTEPYLFDSNYSLNLSGFFFDRRFRDWDEQRLGGRVGIGRQLTPDLSLSIGYRGESVNVHDLISPAPAELLEVEGSNILHGFRVSATHDTRDSPFLATQGHFIELSGEHVIGSFDYSRATIDVRQYFLVHQQPDRSGRHVISLSAKAGITGKDTPIYDHFFAGGFSTLRGFDFRGASPIDPMTGAQLGGEFMLLGSAEYLMPVTADDMMRLVFFCDAGTVEDDVRLENFRVAPGIGLRIAVAALGPAPLALDFAFPISKSEFDQTQVFTFNLGLLR